MSLPLHRVRGLERRHHCYHLTRDHLPRRLTPHQIRSLVERVQVAAVAQTLSSKLSHETGNFGLAYCDSIISVCQSQRPFKLCGA